MASLFLCVASIIAATGHSPAWSQSRFAPVVSWVADVPIIFLALPLPLMGSWTAGQIALVDELIDERPRASAILEPFLRPPLTEPNYWLAFAFWLGSVALFFAILSPWHRLRSPKLAALMGRVPWLEVGAVAALTLVAFGVRIFDVVGGPSPFSGDEANFGIDALLVVEGVRDNMFAAADPWGQPSMYHFMIAGFFKVFGVGILAVRLPSVLFGVSMVPLMYLLLREQFDKRVALVGAAFLVVYAFHIHFSRVGYNNMSAAWIGVLTLLFSARAVRTHAPLDFGLAGAAAGLALYSYAGARVVPIVLALYFAWVILFNWRFLRENFGNFLVMVAGFAVVAGPQALFFIDQTEWWSRGQDQLNIFQNDWIAETKAERDESAFTILVTQFRDAFSVLVVAGERFIHFNSGQPLLDMVSRVLFVVGGAVAVFRVRQPQYFVHLALLIITVVMGAALLEPPPSAARLITSIPALAALVAVGLVGLGDAITRMQPRLSPALPVLGGAVVCVIAVLNLQFYFGDYLGSERFVLAEVSRNDEYAEVGNYLSELGPGYAAFLFSPEILAADPTIEFLARDRTLIDVPPGGLLLTDVATDETDATFVIDPSRADELQVIRAACPGGEMREFSNSRGEVLFVAYQMPGGRACVRAQGLTITVAQPSSTNGVDDPAVRDERRRADLDAIAAALEQYVAERIVFPSTDGRVVALCVLPRDEGCVLREYLDTIPADPLGDAATNGYFYASDGLSYSVFAILEEENAPGSIDCPFYDAGSLPARTAICVTGRWR